MIRFLQPECLWLLALLPIVMLLRGRRGPVAAVEFSDVGLAREVARPLPGENGAGDRHRVTTIVARVGLPACVWFCRRGDFSRRSRRPPRLGEGDGAATDP